MAQSAIAKLLVGVTVFCDKTPQNKSVWEKWFSTAKLAIIAKETIPVDKPLRPRPTSAELKYPQEPIYEPPTSDATAKEKIHRGQHQKKS